MNFLITSPFNFVDTSFDKDHEPCEDKAYTNIKNDLLPDGLTSRLSISKYFIQQLEISILDEFDISITVNHVSIYEGNTGIISYIFKSLDFSIVDHTSNEISKYIIKKLINLKAFKNFEPNEPLWSGRILISDVDNKHNLAKWLGLDSSENLPEYIVSSGNNFFPSFYCDEDIIRSYTYAQIIYARYFILSSKLKKALLSLQRKHLLDLIDERDSCDTLIKESKIGIQSQRKTWTFEWLKAWDVISLKELNDHRIQIINNKIDQYYRRKNLKYNRIQSFIFSLIASITLVDLSLNLLNTSKGTRFNNTDGFYGILDFIEHQSADIVILISIFIACFISILTIKGDKS